MKQRAITYRNGIIESAASELARSFPLCSESCYRQNIWSVIPAALSKGNSVKRKAYYIKLSALGLTRLYNAIAKEAYRLDCRTNPRLNARGRKPSDYPPIIIGGFPH